MHSHCFYPSGCVVITCLVFALLFVCSILFDLSNKIPKMSRHKIVCQEEEKNGSFFDTFRGRYSRLEKEAKQVQKIFSDVCSGYDLESNNAYLKFEINQIKKIKSLHEDVIRLYTNIRADDDLNLDELEDELDLINRGFDYKEQELLGKYSDYVAFEKPDEHSIERSRHKNQVNDEMYSTIVNTPLVVNNKSMLPFKRSLFSSSLKVWTPRGKMNTPKSFQLVELFTPGSSKFTNISNTESSKSNDVLTPVRTPKELFTPVSSISKVMFTTPKRIERATFPPIPPSSVKIIQAKSIVSQSGSNHKENKKDEAIKDDEDEISKKDEVIKPERKTRLSNFNSMYLKFDKWLGKD